MPSIATPEVAACGDRRPPGSPKRSRSANLDFFYGDSRALKGITLPLYDHKVTAFIGPSGCGKSTLLRVLNRMYDLYPDQRAEGEVMLDGENILSPRQDLNLLRARIGMVFQKPTPFPMTIYDNIAFGIRLYERLPRAELDERVEAALRRAALWDEVKDKLGANGLSLSGGQQQRLCIARTVAVRPEVILFDEPCSALDPISTAKIEELIDELVDDYTIVIVTHNMQQAARVSDFTAFMYLGELIEFDDDQPDLHHAERPAHAGLHHRPLRLTVRRTRGSAQMSEHTVRPSTTSCRSWRRKIAEMGGLAEKQLADSVDALVKRDAALAQRVIAGGHRHRRAAARDRGEARSSSSRGASRWRSTCARSSPRIRVSNDLERVGDLAKNIAKRVVALDGDFPAAEAGRRRRAHSPSWCSPSSRRCSTPMRSATAPRRIAVWQRDDEIDAMYTSLFRELLTYMMEDPRNITFCTHLLFCAKNIERIGDHATNIAETVHYLVDRPAAGRRAAEGRHDQHRAGVDARVSLDEEPTRHDCPQS